MRPDLLTPLFGRVAAIPGIGDKTAKLFDKLLANPRLQGSQARIIDILFNLPINIIDRSQRVLISDAIIDTIVVIKVFVVEYKISQIKKNKQHPMKVIVRDSSGELDLLFFRANPEWLMKTLPIGSTRWVSGKIEKYERRLQIVHPDRILEEQEFLKLPQVEPVYGLTQGLFPRYVTKATEYALNKIPRLDEWHEESVLTSFKLPSFHAALSSVHNPENSFSLSPQHPSRQRLALDELLAGQLALGLIRSQIKKVYREKRDISENLSIKVIESLPYELTNAQKRVLSEIKQDLKSNNKMLRLVQGDVGSGKTIISLISMLYVIETGQQAAFMAPTEILARQHFENIKDILKNTEIRPELLTGRLSNAKRKEIIEKLSQGKIDIIIGTHAILQETIEFKSLGIAIIDEQHRFGVEQRLLLSNKGEAVDLLVMTATPIPRTLALTTFGDMDISILDEKPINRSDIDTRALPISRLEEIIRALHRAIHQGSQAYWVCPLVEENEELDLSAAQDRLCYLQSIFGDNVGLIHGKMKNDEKDSAMDLFKSGKTKILVATTVIEVGVDVSSANIIVIEHAERFGLSQLHQLRGRVGRGQKKSSCILLYKGPLGEMAKSRLLMIRQTQDGFRIAEEDLRLRGEGEILGTKQAGLPSFKVANLKEHARLLAVAHDYSNVFLNKDPNLTSSRGQALRNLLYLFEKDDALRLLRAG
jgi:ATP-dependent DNA helicase RecG